MAKAAWYIFGKPMNFAFLNYLHFAFGLDADKFMSVVHRLRGSFRQTYDVGRNRYELRNHNRLIEKFSYQLNSIFEDTK